MKSPDSSSALELRDVLFRAGFVPCDISACNCGSWHHRYGLPERWEEIKEALREADVLDNSTGNMPLKAIQKLVAQRDNARLKTAANCCLDEHALASKILTNLGFSQAVSFDPMADERRDRIAAMINAAIQEAKGKL